MNRVLYIISEGEDGPVKIGYSIHPQTRLADLQIGNARPLRIFAAWKILYGKAHEAERVLHEELNHAAISGEWFRLNERFMAQYMPDFFLANGFDGVRYP